MGLSGSGWVQTGGECTVGWMGCGQIFNVVLYLTLSSVPLRLKSNKPPPLFVKNKSVAIRRWCRFSVDKIE
jgi:hypothetical protein